LFSGSKAGKGLAIMKYRENPYFSFFCTGIRSKNGYIKKGVLFGADINFW
jgi:hypothetical protein